MWIARDKDGSLWIHELKPEKGSIKKLIGKELNWEDDPVELKEEQL